MAEVYRRVAGQKLEELIAKAVVVQDEVGERAFEIAVRAEDSILEHRQEGHARINITEGEIDTYVWLDDTGGDLAALSIEFGRAGYIDPETGDTYGAMEGLFILSDAAHLKRDKSRRVPKIVRARPGRRKGLR